MSKKLLLIVIVIAVIGIFLINKSKQTNTSPNTNRIASQPTATPSPTPDLPFGQYTAPTIQKKDFYRIVMVGDSMTAALGIHGGKLSEELNKLYQSTPGHQRIIIDNYAISSTSILSLHDQMTKKPGGEIPEALLATKPDLILIESFGYNPLSQLGLTEGQKKQTEILEETMKMLTREHPNTAVMFVATIAPNKQTYGQEVNPGASVAQRTEQAEERMAYIKNHMAYATSHGIPLIDIFSKSLTLDGNGKLLYINASDHIHPSFAGIDLINHEIATFVYTSNIFPR